MRMLWEVWKMGHRELVTMLAVMFGAALVGSGLTAVIVSIDAESYAVMGSFMALIVWAVLTFLTAALSMEKQFGLAVAMGRTRKEFLIFRWVILIVNTAIELLVIAGIHRIEKTAAMLFYRGMSCGFDAVAWLIDYRIIIAALLLIPAASLFLGMLLTKFQRKAFWGIWVVWMAGSILLPKAGHIIADNPDSLPARVFMTMAAGIARLGIGGQLAAVAVISFVFLLVSAAVFRKQAVTQV